MTDPTYLQNQKKIEELDEKVRWAANAMNDEAFNIVNMPFRILECFRGQDRQNVLWCQSRDERDVMAYFNAKLISVSMKDSLLKIMREQPSLRSMPEVTRTLHSRHTDRLAMDIDPVYRITDKKHFFDVMEDIAKQFGITHPLTKGKFIDTAHFELDKVEPLEQRSFINLSPEAEGKRIQRKIGRMKEPAKSRAIKRLEARPIA